MTSRRKYRGPLEANPSSFDVEVQAAMLKAAEWFRDPALLTDPETINWTPPKAAMQIGQLVAIEYLSDKFDGVERIYRHEFDHLRDMAVSPDGRTIIIIPGLKITTRGIEG